MATKLYHVSYYIAVVIYVILIWYVVACTLKLAMITQVVRRITQW